MTQVCRIFTACLAGGNIPTAWRQVKVTFTAKPSKANCNKSSAYHPISLPFFMPKTMKKWWTGTLGGDFEVGSLHQYQFAYHSGKTTETELHYIIAYSYIEEAVEHN